MVPLCFIPPIRARTTPTFPNIPRRSHGFLTGSPPFRRSCRSVSRPFSIGGESIPLLEYGGNTGRIWGKYGAVLPIKEKRPAARCFGFDKIAIEFSCFDNRRLAGGRTSERLLRCDERARAAAYLRKSRIFLRFTRLILQKSRKIEVLFWVFGAFCFDFSILGGVFSILSRIIETVFAFSPCFSERIKKTRINTYFFSKTP